MPRHSPTILAAFSTLRWLHEVELATRYGRARYDREGCRGYGNFAFPAHVTVPDFAVFNKGGTGKGYPIHCMGCWDCITNGSVFVFAILVEYEYLRLRGLEPV